MNFYSNSPSYTAQNLPAQAYARGRMSIHRVVAMDEKKNSSIDPNVIRPTTNIMNLPGATARNAAFDRLLENPESLLPERPFPEDAFGGTVYWADLPARI
ncbi:hypothetical protein MMC06_006598 [Schaereria dolodes]|nr:hypothetical protein [Schaereria dolodes]